MAAMTGTMPEVMALMRRTPPKMHRPVSRASAITSGIVPVMAAIYIALGLFITVKNIGQVPYMLSMIVSQAFDPKAMFAGIGASCIMQGIKMCIRDRRRSSPC